MYSYEMAFEIGDEHTRAFRYDDHISYVREYLGDFVDDYDVDGIAREAFEYNRHADGYVLVLDGSDFEDCVKRHEMVG